MAIHHCYGLTWHSTTELPELGLVDARYQVGPPDIEIVDGTVGDPPEAATSLPYGMWRSATSFGLAVRDVARYRVDAGRRITIERARGADEDMVRLYLLGTVMGALLVQRDLLVLHGNSVRQGDSCAVIVGHSGSGKSTLAAEFVRRGLDVLADDVVPVDAHNRALPGYPRLKLWENSLDVLGLRATSLQRLSSSIEKYHVPVARGPLDPLPVRWIYVLERHEGAELELTQVHGLATYEVLREHTYRRELIHDDVASWRHLKKCADLTSSAQVIRVGRPSAVMTPAGTADAILADVRARRATADTTWEHA